MLPNADALRQGIFCDKIQCARSCGNMVYSEKWAFPTFLRIRQGSKVWSKRTDEERIYTGFQ
jgi:hypothetical protein